METQIPVPPVTVENGSNGSTPIDLSVVKKRGRPIIHGRYSTKGATPGQNGETRQTAPKPPKPSPVVESYSDGDADFIAESAVMLLESGDEVISRTLARKLAQYFPERTDEFKKLREEVGLNDKDRAMLRATVHALIKKYGILGKFGPELALGIFALQYSLRQLKLTKFVNELIETKKPQNVTPSAPIVSK